MHSTVCVVLRHDQEITLADLLAPFDENTDVAPYVDADGDATTYNPESRWDWWQLGGRWAGMLTLRPSATPAPIEAYGAKGTGDSCRTEPDGQHVSVARKADIDFERMAYEQVETLRKNYAQAVADADKRGSMLFYGVDLSMSEEEHVRANVGFACRHLLIDGTWYSREVSDYSEVPYKEWVREFNGLLAGVDDDDLLAVVDIHI